MRGNDKVLHRRIRELKFFCLLSFSSSLCSLAHCASASLPTLGHYIPVSSHSPKVITRIASGAKLYAKVSHIPFGVLAKYTGVGEACTYL